LGVGSRYTVTTLDNIGDYDFVAVTKALQGSYRPLQNGRWQMADGRRGTVEGRLPRVPDPAGTQKFLPPPGVILGATSVYKCDKGVFARVFCVLKCVHKCVQRCVQCVQSVSEWLMGPSRTGRELRVERLRDGRRPRTFRSGIKGRGCLVPNVSSPRAGVCKVLQCNKPLFAKDS